MVKIKEFFAVFSTIALFITIIFVLMTKSHSINYFQPLSLKPDPVEQLLQTAYHNFKIPREGIIHIGARYADELDIYKNNKIKNILWIEADPTATQKLEAVVAKDPGSKVAIFAATNNNGFIDLYRTTNEGYSSSILKLKNHVFMSPDVKEDKVMQVPQRRLDDYLSETPELKDIKYNVVVLDIQGAELIALQGATQTLRNIDAIIAEVNHDELYDGAVLVSELDKFLLEHSFIRVDSLSINRAYGNSLYVKGSFCTFKK